MVNVQLFSHSNIMQPYQIDCAPAEKLNNYIPFRFVLLFLSLTLLFSESTGQNISPGHPLLRNYTPEEMGGQNQNWKIVQDNRDVMYFANQKGVIEYDGTYWNRIDINGEKTAYAMAMDKEGTMYVGCEGDFGKLIPDEKGQLQYMSLMHLLPEELKDFKQRVFQIICYDNRVYFNTYYERITYDIEQNLIEVLIYPERFFLGHIVDDNYYVSSGTRGLVKIENDSLIDMPNASFFKNMRIEKMLKNSENNCFVFTRHSGVYEYGINSGDVTQIDLDPALLNDITTNILYEVVRLPSGDIELSTLFGGSYILTPVLAVKNFFNHQSGIQDETIISCLIANDESIWYGLNSGVTHLKIDIPIWNLGKHNNLKGIIWDMAISNNNLLAATSSGLFLCDLLSLQPTFNEILNEDGNSLGLTTTIQVINNEYNNEQVFLAGSMTGIQEIKLEKTSKKGYSIRGWKKNTYYGKILQSRYNPQLIYEGFDGGVSSSSMIGNQFEEQDRFLIQSLITKLVETEEHIIWTGLENGTLFKMDFFNHAMTEYNIQYLAPEENIRFYDFYFWDNVLHIFTTAGTYQYSKEEDKFVTARLFKGIEFLQKKKIIHCSNDSAGNFYITCYEIEKGVKKYYDGMVCNSGSYKNKFVYFAEIPSDEHDNIFCLNDSISWFAFEKEIYAVNVNRYLNDLEPRSVKRDYTCLIRKITSTDNVMIYGGYNVGNLEDLSLTFKQRDLKIEWSAPYFQHEEKTLYKYALTGRKKLQNMHWDRITEMQLINLPPGKYRFTVEALNVRDEISQPAIFSFMILFPWYMKWYMFILYSICVLYLIRLTYKLYSKKLIRDNIRLETVVSDRTREIRQQKEIIENKNLQITSSINYAKHIQDSILLPEEDIKQFIPDLFIYNQPREIVSGDFYWFSKVSETMVFATIDCTGHGVPGAFMSMIGNTLLNDIVNGMNIIKPSQILKYLNRGIKQALLQNLSETHAQDGMDLALCTINLESRTLQYCGAKNPLYLIRDQQLEVIKADPWSIGGRIKRSGIEKEIEFTNHIISLDHSVTVYMFSDGYLDQFGGEDGEKFSIDRFNKLLIKISGETMEEQKIILTRTMEDWKKNQRQIDDMLVIGIRF